MGHSDKESTSSKTPHLYRNAAVESMMSGVVEKFANEETDEWTKDEMEQFIDNFMENTGSNESEIADNIVKVKERALDEILIDIALEDRIFE